MYHHKLEVYSRTGLCPHIPEVRWKHNGSCETSQLMEYWYVPSQDRSTMEAFRLSKTTNRSQKAYLLIDVNYKK